jgi:hypothetical protein
MAEKSFIFWPTSFVFFSVFAKVSKNFCQKKYMPL